MTMRASSAIVALLSVFILTSAHSSTGAPISVYRSSDGTLTEASKTNVRLLQRIARRNGYVTLWITANTPFEPLTSGLSEKAAKEQEEKARSLFEKTLGPLIKKGLVWFPKNGLLMEGPGCLIRADRQGVSRLVKDKRILHISMADN